LIRLLNKGSAFALFGLLALVTVGALANGAVKMRPAADEDHRLAVVAVPGYHVALFTSASWLAQPVANPDSVVVSGGHVFIDYQNHTAKGRL
jgi:hypothetical protein